jgi:hypothetical protein
MSMKSSFLLILAPTAVAWAASRDDFPVQPPAEPQDIGQEVVHTIVYLFIVDDT